LSGSPAPVQIAPSILSADFATLGSAVAAVERGGADLIHVDVMDGHFVPNITIGPPVVQSLKRVTRVPLDVHLMITDPDRYIEAFASAGAAMISVHVEVLPHLHRTVQAIKALGVKAGVVLNPSKRAELPTRRAAALCMAARARRSLMSPAISLMLIPRISSRSAIGRLAHAEPGPGSPGGTL